jgi:uncharacterized protein (TIGR02444 family)
LQERCGVDVNVLLFLLYLARAGRSLSAADVERIEMLAAPWQHAVVVPLRSVRRALKESVGEFRPETTAGLRTEVKRAELAAERVQQETLERLFPVSGTGEPGSDPAACARTHFERYGARMGGLEREPAELVLARFTALYSGDRALR